MKPSIKLNKIPSITPPPGSVSAIPTSVTFLFDTADNGAVKARFNWVTSDMTILHSVLKYAKKDGFNGIFTETIIGESFPIDQRDLYETFMGNDKNEVQLTPIISHKAESLELEPDTEYVYSVGDGGVHVTDTTNLPSFRTPAANIDEFSFLWITDSQESGIDVETAYRKYEHFMGRAVKTAMKNHPNIDFIISTGDNVDFGFDTKLWDAYYYALQPYLYNTPYYSATGNHEYEGNPRITGSWESIDPYMVTAKGRINVPKNGPAYKGAGTNGLEPIAKGAIKQRLDGNTYYFEYGDAIFLVLDYSDNISNIDETGDKGFSFSSDKVIKDQLDWMKSVLKEKDKKWRIVAMHHGPYLGRLAQPEYWKTVTDAFDESGIDVVLSGHDHLYLRSKLMNNNQVTTVPGTGTTYITGGTAGSGFDALYGHNNDIAETYTEKYTDWVVSSYHVIDVNGSGISITSKGIKMLPIDGVTEQQEDNASAFKEDENGYRDLDVSSKVVLTNTPRTKNLSSWKYPNPPVEQP
ncbi:purple acid phosphatase family protein [Lederbergia citrea]|uniref:purple acid phosphatase family protein n=1 Tax=Lederbergia citrea TaxID=2833581 RepID=UPI001BCA4C6F|nr:metallophosphoesterase family protein [Lederbergia citrea]MBS4205459.1 metallophosphoesterase family protein [Lederbergia citrea]